jgi:hypothetical protein
LSESGRGTLFFERRKPGMPAPVAQRLRELGGKPRLARPSRPGEQADAQVGTGGGPIEQVLLFPVAPDQLSAESRCPAQQG